VWQICQLDREWGGNLIFICDAFLGTKDKLIPKRDNGVSMTESDPTYYNLEIIGLDIPKASESPKRLRKAKNIPRTKPPLFKSNSYEMTATGSPVISATQAYLKSPDWQEYAPGCLYFQKPFSKNRYIEFYVINQQKHQPEYIASQAEREIIECYGVMAARLHAVFATYAASSAEPWKEPFVLLGSELIKTLKVYNTKKLTKSQKLKAISDLAWVVGTLGAVIHWHEGNLNLCVRERSLLWNVSVQEYIQPNLFTEVTEIYEVVIRVQPGLWTYNFLNAEGERKQQALYQYGTIPKQLFDIDPHRQKLAASLALYLVQNSRAHKNGTYMIGSLLGRVLPEATIQRAIGDRRYGGKLKESFDNALLILQDTLNLTIEFDEKTYPQWLRPLWSLPDKLNEKSAQEKNWHFLGTKRLPKQYLLDSWLKAKLAFKLPSEVEESSKETNSQSSEVSVSQPKKPSNKSVSKKLPTPKDVLTGAVVKQVRKQLGMSQTELALAMSKSQSWVRDIENKFPNRAIQPKYSERLKVVLKIV
jgi:DNA-binding transcriptional regulator YiaG